MRRRRGRATDATRDPAAPGGAGAREYGGRGPAGGGAEPFGEVAPAGAIGVRAMTAEDLAAVLAIEQSSFPVPWTPATFRSLLRRRDARLWVAERAGEVVGYAVVWVVLDQAELGDIAVAESARRRGIGTRLLEAVLAWLAGRGVREVFLEVRESNVGAQRLYRRHGFVEVGRRRGYYSTPTEDALVLRRPVDPEQAGRPVR